MDSIYYKAIPFIIATIVGLIQIYFCFKPKVSYWYSDRIMIPYKKGLEICCFTIDIFNCSFRKTIEDIVIIVDGRIDKFTPKPSKVIELNINDSSKKENILAIKNLGSRESVSILVISFNPDRAWTYTIDVDSASGKGKYLENKLICSPIWVQILYITSSIIVIYCISKLVLGLII